MLGHIVRRFVEAAVPGPLVHDAKLRELAAHHGHAVLRQHRHAQLVDEVGDRVIHRRIHMVGPAGEDDAHLVILSYFRKHPLRLGGKFLFICRFRSLAGRDGPLDFAGRNMHPSEGALQLREERLAAMERQEGMEQVHLIAREHFVHIRVDVLRVRCHHGAVVAIRAAFLRPLVHAGIPDKGGMPLRQIRHMGVGELGGEALRVRRDGLHGVGSDVADLLRRRDDPIAQARKESMPEGEILVHIQHPGDPHGAAGRFLGR